MNRYRLATSPTFKYDGIVSESYNDVRLRPRDDQWQSCLSFRLQTHPGVAGVSAYLDNWGTGSTASTCSASTGRCASRRSRSCTSRRRRCLPRRRHQSPDARRDARRAARSTSTCWRRPATCRIPRRCRSSFAAPSARARARCPGSRWRPPRLIHQRFRYEKGATHVQSTVLDALGSGAGVCQDFAHIMLAMVRMRGIPGRYVSGYLRAAERDRRPGQRRGCHRRSGVARAGSEMLMPGLRVDRPRSDAGPAGRAAPHPRRVRARLRRRRAGPRRVHGPRRPAAVRRRRRAAGARRRWPGASGRDGRGAQ